jgi:predicted nuclease of predicted toxin-antitoxin system
MKDAIIITMDKDFGELVFREKNTHKGILLLR